MKLSTGTAELAKRETLIGMTLAAMGKGADESYKPHPEVFRKFLTEWMLWKWASLRGFDSSSANESTPRYELWSKDALELITDQTMSRSQAEKHVRHEHLIPRKVLADEIVGLAADFGSATNGTDSQFWTIVEKRLRLVLESACFEVTILKTEDDELNALSDGILKKTAPKWAPERPEKLLTRYEALKEEMPKFEVQLVRFWKSGQRWKCDSEGIVL